MINDMKHIFIPSAIREQVLLSKASCMKNVMTEAVSMVKFSSEVLS